MAARRKLLTEVEVGRRLESLTTWKRLGNAITRTWEFEDFPSAVSFLVRVGFLAEAENHHPDIRTSWTRVTLSLTTHDAGGLTERDFDLARKIDALHARPK